MTNNAFIVMLAGTQGEDVPKGLYVMTDDLVFPVPPPWPCEAAAITTLQNPACAVRTPLTCALVP